MVPSSTGVEVIGTVRNTESLAVRHGWPKEVQTRLQSTSPHVPYVCIAEGALTNREAHVVEAIWALNHRTKVDAVVRETSDSALLVLRRQLWEKLWGILDPEATLHAVCVDLSATGARMVRLTSDRVGDDHRPQGVKVAFWKFVKAIPAVRSLKPTVLDRAVAPLQGRDAPRTDLWPEAAVTDDRAATLFIVPWLEIGGADKVNLDLLRNLSGTKYRKIVVTTMPSRHPWQSLFEEVADEIYHLPSIAPEFREALDFLHYLVTGRGIDLIQISNSRVGYRLLGELRSRVHIPTVSLVHTQVPKDPWDFVRVSLRYQYAVDQNVAVSETLRRHMIASGFSPEAVHTVHNGVDTNKFKPRPDQLMKNGGQRTVLFVGRMVEQKNPVAFVEMASQLLRRKDLDDLRFLMIGDGPLLGRIQAKIQSEGASERIRLLHTLEESDVIRCLQMASLLVMPSRWEGLPIVGLEALACGVPIVATRVDGWTEVIDHNRTGLLVGNSPRDLAEAVEGLALDTRKWELMSREARLAAKRKFSLERMVSSYEDIYASMLAL